MLCNVRYSMVRAMVIMISSKPTLETLPPGPSDRTVPATVRNAGPKAVESYLRFFGQFKSRPASVASRYRSAARRFFAWCEECGLPLDALRPEHAARFLDVAASEWQPSTLYQYVKAIRHLFRELAADGVLVPSPFRDVAIPVPRPRPPARSLSVPVVRPEKRGTLADLKEFLLELDHITEGSSSYRPGLVAMYPVVIGGMDVREIAADTGIPLDEVEAYAGRLRENRIWREDGRLSVTFEPGDDDIATFVVEMVLIVGCAAGIFQRFPPEKQTAEASGAMGGADAEAGA